MAKAEKITEKYVTGKGELVGFVAICTPSTKFDKEGTYSANILLPKEEGEKLAAKIKEVRTQQFKTYGKGTKIKRQHVSGFRARMSTPGGQEVLNRRRAKGRHQIAISGSKRA